jgi:glycosyltransferase involved in cell wall biosynthesis
MMRPRVLRIFSRYQHFGGEEAAARRVHTELAEFMDADWFESSTDEFLGKTLFSRLRAPVAAVHNAAIADKLRKAQRANRYAAWEVHNVFPALSPSVYATAFELGVPVIHFLHNYRLACVNGEFLNHGKPCTRCINGNFWAAIETVCWRNSRVACAVTGISLTRVRSLRVFEKVGAWVALSEAQKRIHLQMGLPEMNLHVVPHFLSTNSNQQTPVPDDGYALFLGRLSTEKGLSELLRAWKKITTPRQRLVIAGTGPQEAELKRLSRDLALHNVEFRGFVERSQHDELWAKAKFLIVPSIWHEPFPLVVLEGMAHGRPLVVSDLGSLSETVGEAGLVVDPFQAQQVAAACHRLFEDHDLARRMGAAGLARIQGQYHRTLWLERMKKVYARCGVALEV